MSGSSGGGETFAGMLPRDEPRSSSPQVGSPSTLSPSSEQGPFFDDQGSSKEKKDSSQTQCRSQHQRQQQYQYERRRAQGMDSLSSIPSRMDSMNSLPSVGSDNVPIIRADDQSPPLAESPVMAESPTSTTPSSMGSRSESGSGNEEKGGDGDGGGGKAVDRVHGKVEVEQEDEQERSMPGHFSIEQVGRKLKDTWLDEERLEGEGGREEVRGHTHEREHEHQHVHVRERDGHDGEKGVQEPLRRHERKRGREHIHLRRAVAEGHNNRDGPFKEGDEGHDAENADDHHLHPNTQNKAGGHRSGDGSGDGGGEGDHDPDLLPPKLLDGPWAKSPMSENIPTPPGAAEAYSGRYFSESP